MVKTETALVFEDRVTQGDWRVEWFDKDGACEVAMFSGPKARERALAFAERYYGKFEETELDVHWRSSQPS